MSFVKLQDGRSTYALDSLRLRSRKNLDNAPQQGVVELFVRNNSLVVMLDDGTEYSILLYSNIPGQSTGDSIKETFTLAADAPTSVTLQELAVPDTLIVSIERVLLYEGEDYTLTTSGGVTQINFLPGAAGRPENPTAGDKVRVQYRKVS